MSKYSGRHKKKKTKNKNHSPVFDIQTDVTLQEFADSNKQLQGSSRIKKGFTSIHSVNSQVKTTTDTMIKSDVQLEELNWYEKDLNDFDVDRVNSGETEEEETETVALKPKFKNGRKNLKLDDNRCEEQRYPLDLWIVIAQHIHPEDIGRFAGICRYSNMVVQTVQFWKHIYQMYCAGNFTVLPQELHPCTLECIHGLRHRVIRALFHVYAPLSDRTKTTVPFENEPYHLIGHRCILYWHEKIKNMWVFNFKFKEETLSSVKYSLLERKRHYDLLHGHNDLFYNPVNGCYVLQVICQNFIDIPPIMGLSLSQIYIKVGHGMRYHCLTLILNSNVNSQSAGRRNCLSGDVVVAIDPAVNLKVFPWWHPKYPIIKN